MNIGSILFYISYVLLLIVISFYVGIKNSFYTFAVKMAVKNGCETIEQIHEFIKKHSKKDYVSKSSIVSELRYNIEEPYSIIVSIKEDDDAHDKAVRRERRNSISD